MTAAARKAFDEAVILENSGDLDMALVSYLKAQELSPQDTEIAYRTASALLQAGFLEEAQSQLRRIVFSEPDHLKARSSLGNCQLLMGDHANASLNFKEILEQEPNSRNALFGLATVKLKEGKAVEAETLSRKLLEHLPGSAAALSLFADSQAKTRQIAPAIATYRKALKIDQKYVPALLGLSETLLLGKRYDEVIRHTIRASQLTPKDPLPLELLSDALGGKGELEDAFEAAEAAFKLGSRSVVAFVRLSVLSRKLGNYTSALKYALAAHDVDKNAHEPFNALGTALASLKHSKKARAVLTATAEQGLDGDIRAFVENLVENETNDSAPGSVPSNKTKNARHGGAVLDSASDEAALAEENENSEGHRKQQVESVTNGQNVPSGNVSDDEFHLPNVLGLSRQDRS
jgi:tetratricopeptide (TPR) repeat protein